jgi:D-isomer specific 2-hydroxyacid dehydrogenase-like protein
MPVRGSSAEWQGNVEDGSGIVTVGDSVFSATDLAAGVTAPRYRLHEGPLRVLVGKERFSENHAWSEMPLHWPSRVADRAVIEVVGQGRLEARLVDGGPPVDVVVPLWSPLPGRAIRAGGFGLIQQFGVGVDNIDLDAAVGEGVWVANMPGLNAVPVAEHAVALLLALARRLPEAPKGFERGRWGEPAGRSLAGTAACIVGAGAVGTQIALRLAAFGVTVTGVRRRSQDGPVPPFAAVYSADRLLECVADVDSVIIAASQQAGQPPTRASWRPPTPPPSPATTSQPRAGDSATPSPATSIISHLPASSDERGTNLGRGHPDAERKPRERCPAP